MVVFGDLVFKISEQGADKRKLGRWGYIPITDKHEINTSIFTCYCLYRGKSPSSAY